MGQDFNIGIVGGGPAGCCCAYFLSKYSQFNITVIDSAEPLKTILPTGGGRCNLAHAEFDFKELVKNYPRGEKFLYSLFSKFGTAETLSLFDELGVKTYIQPDGRIFPVSNDSREVRTKFLSKLKNCNFKKEKVVRIEKNGQKFMVVTDISTHSFDKVICSLGGHSDFNILKNIGITIIPPKPSLVGLVTKENFTDLKGIVIKDCYSFETGLSGDVLFTHFGISGPLIYKISSIKARDTFPYDLRFKLTDKIIDFQEILNKNSNKYIKNILADYLPQKFCKYILDSTKTEDTLYGHNINGKTRDSITELINNFKTTVITTKKDGETVSAGGADLNKINPKTMESKEVSGLYFCGEVINVDGFCGGFNLQNCWSSAYIAAQGIISQEFSNQ